MQTRPLIPWLVCLLALVCASPLAAAPGKKRDPNRTITRYKKYLSRKPYHTWAFDKLVEAAVSVNKLNQLVTDYQRQVKEEPDDRAAKVVLVRLLAKTNKVEDALKQLELVTTPDAGLHKLRGELHLRRNEPKLALAALEQAAAATTDKTLLQEIQRRRGEAALMAGRRVDAVKAFRAMAELQPRSFNTRLDVAGVFAQHNLVEEALTAFVEAEKLAGNNTAKRCRVLAEKGRLFERLIRIKESLEVYRQAIGLMGRGNWLKRELCERVLAIHKRSGQLDALLKSCRDQVATSPADLDAREFLAQALVAADKKTAARDVLQAATKSFPEDLPLSRRLITLLRDIQDTAGVIAEYQRAIEKHPRELDLYLELGKVFASSGKLEQAKRQWERSLGKRLKDASLCVRLAELYAFYDQPEESIRLYKKAIELEPKEVRHAGDLARYLAARGRQAEVRPLLEAATKAAAGNPGGLEQAGRLWQEHGHTKDALKALQGALALKPQDPRLLTVLADLQVGSDQLDAAAKTLHELINQAKEQASRRAAVDKLVRLVRKKGNLDNLIKTEAAAVAKKTPLLSPYLLLAKAWSIKRHPKRAIEVLEALLKVRPGFEDAHAGLARFYTGQGDYAKALANYQALVKASPQARRKYLKAIARIHLTLYQHEKAFACYEEILRGSPDNPSAFKEVGEAYAKLNMIGKARDCLQQAVRLKPEDARFRLELAKLHQRLGDTKLAKQELVLAIRSAEEEALRDDARGKLYELLGEEGRIDEEVTALKTRVEKNPYDIEAPLALVDIFIRELEYEQALELLDKLLGYQPKERRLLTQRARIQFLLERYPEAIRDFESLWKLPKSDLEELGLKIAECALKAGDLPRAKRALESVKDAEAIADLYEAHEMMPEAVAALELGAKRSPSNARLFQQLSKKLNKVERRGDAIASLERVIALRGERWDTVLELGNLYRQAGKTDEALEVGKRLFTIIRLKTKPEKKKKKRARLSRRGGSSGYSSYWNSYYSRYNYYRRGQGFTSPTYRRRVGQLRGYFTGLSKEDEFTRLGRAELELQPRNPALLTEILRPLRRGRDKEGKGIDILREVYAATVLKKTHPPGFTLQTWADNLDRQIVARYRQDNDLCKKRVAELEGMVKTTQPPQERQWIELIQLLESLRRYDEAKIKLAEGIKALPTSYRLELALAHKMHGEKKPAEAAGHYRRAIELLTANPVDVADIARQREQTYKQNRQNLVQGFPAWFRSKVREEHLRRLFKLTRSRWVGTTSWGLGSQVGLESIKQTFVAVLVKVGGEAARAEARAVIKSLEPDDPERLQEWSVVGGLYFRNEFYEDAERTSRALLTLERKLDRDPILGHNRRWASSLSGGVGNLARVLERKKEFLKAYELYRTYGNAGAGELILKSEALLDAAADHYRKACETEESAAKAGDPAARRRYREAGIKWAEILQYGKKWTEVIGVFERLIKVLTDDFALYAQVAALHQRAGRSDAAVATHQRIIVRKRELNRTLRRDLMPKGRQLTPLTPPGGGRGNEDWIWRSLRGGGYSTPRGQRHSVRTNYAAILKTYLDRRQIGKAAEAMRRLAREDMSTFRWLGWYIGRLIENYRLGAKGVPIMRLLYSYNPTYDHLGIQYGKALVAAKRWKEAKRVLSEVVNRSGSRGYYGRQAQASLDRAEAKLQGKTSVTLDDLRAAVAKEPRSMKKRLRLASRLMDERRFREALVQVRDVRKHAPHMAQGKQLLRGCYRALGMRKEFVAELRKELKGATGSNRFGKLLELVEESYDGQPGEAAALTPKVKALLAEADAALAKAGANQQRWSTAMWYLMRGYFAEGKTRLEAELEKVKAKKDQADTIRAKLNQLAFADGDPLPSLEFVWKRMKEQTTASGQSGIVTQLAATLRTSPYPERYRKTVFAAATKHGGVRGDLYRLAYYLAVHDATNALKELEAAIAKEGKRGYYLHSLRIRLLRKPDDKAGELKMVEAQEALRVAGKLDAFGQSDDQAKKGFQQRKAGLLLAMKKKREAMKVWEAEYDASIQDNMRRLADLYEQHGDYDAAVKMLKKYIAKKGDKQYRLLEKLARLYERQEKWDDAIELYRRVMILQSSRASSSHGNIRRCYKASERLPEYRKQLEAKVKADPDDMEAIGYLIALSFEMKDEARAIELLKLKAKRPQLSQSAWTSLADHYWSKGDRAEAVKYMEKRLAGNADSWQMRQMTERLAEYHLEAKNMKKTLELLKKGYQDPESAQALEGMASFLLRQDAAAAALPMLQAASQQKPRNARLHQQLSNAYREAGQMRKALDHLVTYLLMPESLGQTSGKILAYLADRCGEDARVEAALKAANAAPAKGAKAREARAALTLRSALLLVARRQWKLARARFEAALKLEPENLVAAWGLMDVAWNTADLPEAQRRIEALYERTQREPNKLYGARSLLTQRRSEVRLRQGDLAGARAVWRKIERMQGAGSYRYAYYNDPFGWIGAEVQHLQRHHQYDAWRARLERGLLLAGGSYGDQFSLALFRTGKHELALQRAWRSLIDPVRGVMSSGSSYGSKSYRWRSRRYGRSSFGGYSSYSSSSRSGTALLLAFYRELGREAELRKRLEALEAEQPKNSQVRSLLDQILRRNKEHELLLTRYRARRVEALTHVAKRAAERAERKLPPKKPQPITSYQQEILTQLLALERWEEALALQLELLAAHRIFAKRGNTSWRGSSSYNSFGRRYYGSRYGSSISQRARGLVGARQQAMALLAKVGRRDEAKALEAEALAEALPEERKTGSIHSVLANAYTQVKLGEDAARLYAIARTKAEKPVQRRSLWEAEAQAWKEIGDKARETAAILEVLKGYDEEQAEQPWQSSLVKARAWFLIDRLHDLPQALRLAEGLVKDAPRDRGSRVLLGWAQYRSGQKAQALASFKQAQTLMLEQGGRYDANLLYGLGLSLAGDDLAAATPLLRRALTLHAHSDAADEAREVLK